MKTILVVEDNPQVAKFYCLALERAGGYRCLLSESGDEIVARARRGEVDAIILDISLANCTYQGQRVDGLEIARILKADAATRHLPILLATAHTMEGDRERFLAASGADAYIEKPIYDPQLLIQHVEQVFRR